MLNLAGADWCRLCWVHVFSGAGLFFELKSESAGPPDPLHATHSSRCPKFASNWSQVGAPSRGVIAIFAANCLFLSLSRWRYVDLNLALSKTLGDPVHSYLISWRWFSRVLRDVFFFLVFMTPIIHQVVSYPSPDSSPRSASRWPPGRVTPCTAAMKRTGPARAWLWSSPLLLGRPSDRLRRWLRNGEEFTVNDWLMDVNGL